LQWGKRASLNPRHSERRGEPTVMKHPRSIRTLLALALVATAPGLMAPSCLLIPAKVNFVTPQGGDVVPGPNVSFELKFESVDRVRILVDGIDRTADFPEDEVIGFDSFHRGTIALSEGEHTVIASGLGELTQDTKEMTFTVGPAEAATPDDIVTGEIDFGEIATIRGTVKGTSYRTHDDGNDPFVRPKGGDAFPLPHRYVLLEIGETGGLSVSQIAWGVGVRLSAEQVWDERIRLPYPGDVIEAKELFGGDELFSNEERYVLQDVTQFELVSRGPRSPVLADIGEACEQDTECRDDLICGRDTGVCEEFEAISWAISSLS